MDEATAKEIKAGIKDLSKKLDAYHEQTIKNTTDIVWLKKGMFGSFFTYIGVVIWTSLGMGGK